MCSIVIDGMDQAHCMIPRLGSAQHFGAAIPQHITGVLEHSTVRDIDAGEAGPAGSKLANPNSVLHLLKIYIKRNLLFLQIYFSTGTIHM